MSHEYDLYNSITLVIKLVQDDRALAPAYKVPIRAISSITSIALIVMGSILRKFLATMIYKCREKIVFFGLLGMKRLWLIYKGED